MGIEGLLGHRPPASGSVLSLGSGKVARGNQEKVRLPAESTRHLFSSQQQQRRGKCSKQVHKREERAGVFFLPFPFSACPSASVGLVSGIPAPSLLLTPSHSFQYNMLEVVLRNMKSTSLATCHDLGA